MNTNQVDLEFKAFDELVLESNALDELAALELELDLKKLDDLEKLDSLVTAIEDITGQVFSSKAKLTALELELELKKLEEMGKLSTLIAAIEAITGQVFSSKKNLS